MHHEKPNNSRPEDNDPRVIEAQRALDTALEERDKDDGRKQAVWEERIKNRTAELERARQKARGEN